MTKLTRKEHKARALLMGRVYDPRDGTYCKVGDDLEMLSTTDLLDCVTMEVMDPQTCKERMHGFRADYGDVFWFNKSIPCQPWEAEDDEP